MRPDESSRAKRSMGEKLPAATHKVESRLWSCIVVPSDHPCERTNLNFRWPYTVFKQSAYIHGPEGGFFPSSSQRILKVNGLCRRAGYLPSLSLFSPVIGRYAYGPSQAQGVPLLWVVKYCLPFRGHWSAGRSATAEDCLKWLTHVTPSAKETCQCPVVLERELVNNPLCSPLLCWSGSVSPR